MSKTQEDFVALAEFNCFLQKEIIINKRILNSEIYLKLTFLEHLEYWNNCHIYQLITDLRLHDPAASPLGAEEISQNKNTKNLRIFT